jgi:hypothetical protein
MFHIKSLLCPVYWALYEIYKLASILLEREYFLNMKADVIYIPW